MQVGRVAIRYSPFAIRLEHRTFSRRTLLWRKAGSEERFRQNKCGLLGFPESIVICSSVLRRAYQHGFAPN